MKKEMLLFVIVILFAAGCNNEKINDKKSNETRISEPDVSTTIAESDKRQKIDLSIFNGEWSSSTNQINILVKNDDQQIEVDTRYMVGGEMFLADYDSQKAIYTFENKKESICFQVLDERTAIIWYGTMEEETTGASPPIEYTKK